MELTQFYQKLITLATTCTYSHCSMIQCVDASHTELQLRHFLIQMEDKPLLAAPRAVLLFLEIMLVSLFYLVTMSSVRESVFPGLKYPPVKDRRERVDHATTHVKLLPLQRSSDNAFSKLNLCLVN